jgi:hypothetical protein
MRKASNPTGPKELRLHLPSRETTSKMPATVRLVATKLVSSLHRRGFVGTLKSCAEEIDDIWFDQRFGIDTLETIGDRSLPAVPFGTPYQPTKIARLKNIFRELRINFGDYVFLDLGSGKGRALLIASEFRFKRIIGVEVLSELHLISEKNIRAYRSTTQKCGAIESKCCDAALYQMPPENMVLFLSNPFEHPIVSRVLTNLRKSLQSHPREVYFVYHLPVCHDLIIQSGFLEVVRTTDLYTIYKNKLLTSSVSIPKQELTTFPF